MNPLRQYWESSVFVSYLSEEEGRVEIVRDLLDEAYAGRLEIYTSSFTLTEVIKVKGHPPMTQKDEEKLVTFFEYPFINIINADRDICEAARQHYWLDGLKPKDALHLASALTIKARLPLDALFSWDTDFVRIDGLKKFNLQISTPYLRQLLLPFREIEASMGGTDEDSEESGSAPEGE